MRNLPHHPSSPTGPFFSMRHRRAGLVTKLCDNLRAGREYPDLEVQWHDYMPIRCSSSSIMRSILFKTRRPKGRRLYVPDADCNGSENSVIGAAIARRSLPDEQTLREAAIHSFWLLLQLYALLRLGQRLLTAAPGLTGMEFGNQRGWLQCPVLPSTHRYETLREDLSST